jgi:hypothetical protein
VAFGAQDTGLALGDRQPCPQSKIDGQLFQGWTSVVITTEGCGLSFEFAPILPTLLGCVAAESASARGPDIRSTRHTLASVRVLSLLAPVS